MSRFRAALSIVTLRSPFWDRSRKHRFGRLMLHLTIIYVVMLVVLLFLENKFLFPASTADDSWESPPTDTIVQDVSLTSSHDTTIHAWWMKPRGWEPGQGALLYCHGNGGNVSHRGALGQFCVEHKHAILMLDYPGYGKSGGKASEAGCYAAADAAYDWLLNEQKIPAPRVILYGGSLGGAVAVDVASRRPHRALVLVSTFTNFPDMAQKQFPIFPTRWLVRNRFSSLAKIERVHRPVFIAHGDADEIIPFAMGQRLYEAANEPKEFFTMRGIPHVDGCSPDAFAALEQFLKKHAP